VTDHRLHDLTVRYFDGRLGEEEAAELSRALRESAEARRLFAELSVLVVGLTERFHVPADAPLARRAAARGARLRRALAAAAAVLLVGLTAWALHQLLERPATLPPPAFLAQLEEPDGTVVLQPGDRPGTPGAQVASGDTVATVGLESSVIVRCPDGNRLCLAGDTSVRLTRTESGLGLYVERGEVAAGAPIDVRTDLPAHPYYSLPLRLLTPEGELDIRSTQMLITRRQGRTRLGLLEGQAVVTTPEAHQRLVLKPDDRVEVAQGKIWRGARPKVPDAIALRFGPDLPPDWEAGQPATGPLPPGSTGGVEVVPVALGGGETKYHLQSMNRWVEGMFAIHDDTWLSLRYRVRRAGSFRLLVGTRARDMTRLSVSVVEAPPFWGASRPGAWHSVDLPLAEFRVLKRGAGGREGRTAWQVVLNSGGEDLGLAIDRLWVSRGPRPAPFPE
jgi:ferric-dicitrate binding protein FerR (iron transport regulator)